MIALRFCRKRSVNKFKFHCCKEQKIIKCLLFQLLDDPVLTEVNNYLVQVFLIFPQYCLGRGLIDMALNQAYADAYASFGKLESFKFAPMNNFFKICGPFSPFNLLIILTIKIWFNCIVYLSFKTNCVSSFFAVFNFGNHVESVCKIIWRIFSSQRFLNFLNNFSFSYITETKCEPNVYTI